MCSLSDDAMPMIWILLLVITHYVAGNDEKKSSKTEEEDLTPHFFTREGVVVAGNFSRFELKTAKPMRIVLDSVQGDADLYFSYSDQGVSYELDKHDASSATCGIDYIDINSSPRPSYLGIYGHPSKNESAYHLLIMVVPDGNFEHGPEVIHHWSELVQQDSEGGSGSIYIDILSGILEILVEVLL